MWPRVVPEAGVFILIYYLSDEQQSVYNTSSQSELSNGSVCYHKLFQRLIYDWCVSCFWDQCNESVLMYCFYYIIYTVNIICNIWVISFICFNICFIFYINMWQNIASTPDSLLCLFICLGPEKTLWQSLEGLRNQVVCLHVCSISVRSVYICNWPFQISDRFLLASGLLPLWDAFLQQCNCSIKQTKKTLSVNNFPLQMWD